MKNFFYFIAVVLLLNCTMPAQTGTDTIQVITGWNLIGSLGSGAIPDIIATEPPAIIVSTFWGFNPTGGYYEADTLNRGKGYWVKVSQNGLIIIILVSTPQPPTLLSPMNWANYVSLPPTLVWNISSGADSYTLQVSEDSSFTSFAYNQTGLTGTNQEISGLINSTRYYWRVNATNSYGTSGWSEVWNFTTESGSGMGDPCPGLPTVFYEGKTYNTVQVGIQCWLRENLDVGAMIAGIQNQTNNDVLEKYCYDNDPANCNTYGGLYQWDEAMQYVTNEGAQGICPLGWHIPTILEFLTLRTMVGGDGNALKEIGQGTGGGAGTNTSGFSALLAGQRDYQPYFWRLGTHAIFWSSIENDISWAQDLSLYAENNTINPGAIFKTAGYSIRCLKD